MWIQKKKDLILGARYTDATDAPGLAANDAFAPCWNDIHNGYLELAKHIKELTKDGCSVLELGAGGGSLFEHCYKLGLMQYIAVDGNPFILDVCEFARLHSEHFRILNLEYEVDFNVKFDVILSFETLEHISNTNNLIKTIINHMHSQSIFIGTSSNEVMPPHHVVVQNRDWWIDAFNNAGLTEVNNSEQIYQKLKQNPPKNWGGNTQLFAMQLANIP